MLPFSSLLQKIQTQVVGLLPGPIAQATMMPPSRGPLVKGMPLGAKVGAVVVLLWQELEETKILLMRRTNTGGTHSGQISFPGGQMDATDGSLTYTALRELQEEMGIKWMTLNGNSTNTTTVVGSLTPLYIPPSNFYVQPILCISNGKPVIHASVAEVEEVLILSTNDIFANKKMVNVSRSDDASVQMETIAYQPTENITIWGATAMMLAEIEIILKDALP